MKILSTTYHHEFPAWTFPDWAVEELKQKFPDTEVVKLTSRERVLDEISNTDILLTWLVRPAEIAAAKKLRWIHIGMSGLGLILIPEVVNSDLIITNSRGVHAIPIAEHTMALMLQLSRRLSQCYAHQQQSISRRREIWESAMPFDELYGKTLCIVGVGALGTEIARRANAFGMRVIGIRKNVDVPADCVERMYPLSMLDELLPSIDYLVIAAPATGETVGIIGRPQFERMKRSAFIVNVARGEIIDQDALVDALNNGRIAGAALDVFVPDPLPDGHPLFSTKNLIVTPHISGVSTMLWRRIMDIWVDNIVRFREGRPLINVVDKYRGY
jgi:phosphoglycerate dehydrogenase-like enzyme